MFNNLIVSNNTGMIILKLYIMIKQRNDYINCYQKLKFSASGKGGMSIKYVK